MITSVDVKGQAERYAVGQPLTERMEPKKEDGSGGL